MPLNPLRPSKSAATAPKAHVIDIVTTLELERAVTTNGQVVWATIEIRYAAESLIPSVWIRVPIPYAEGDTEAYRHDLALRYARQLIDHACVSMGPVEAPPGDAPKILEGTVLEGLAQELGLTQPQTNPGGTADC